MESEEEKTEKCAVCGALAGSKCSSCKNIHYCSLTHQKEHWKTHKNSCTSFKKVFDLSTGVEHVIASRDLKAGLLILEESAAFYAPQWLEQTANKRFEMDELCTACGREIKKKLRLPEIPRGAGMLHISAAELKKMKEESETRYFCSKCKWPLCGEHCEKDKQHSENECKIFTKHKLPFPPPEIGDKEDPYMKYTHQVSMIRGAGLRSLNPGLFSKLQGLQQKSLTPQLQLDLATMDVCSVIQFKTLIHDIVDPETKMVDVEALPLENEMDYHRMYRIIRLNHFGITAGDQIWGDPRSTMYMYYEACLFSHSCVPNCCWSIGDRPDYKIRVRTAIPVKKGEKLTLDRGLIARLHYDGTHERQTYLKERKVLCQCERCVDPTEMGVYSSALTCPQCSQKQAVSAVNNSGYLLSTNALDPKSVWKCNACGYQVESADIFARWKEITTQMNALCVADEAEEQAGKFLDKYNASDTHATHVEELGNKLGLHPNHFVIFSQIKASVIPSFEIEYVVGVNPELIQRRKKRLLYCLAIEDKISPGLSGHRSHLMGSLLTLMYRVLISPIWTDHMSRTEVRANYSLFKMASSEALKYFKHEFPEPGKKVHLLVERISGAMRALEELKPSWLN